MWLLYQWVSGTLIININQKKLDSLLKQVVSYHYWANTIQRGQ
jgi:hypothetical protein